MVTQYESTNVLDFSGFELLAGGSGHDTFDLSGLSGDTSTVLTGKGALDGFSGTSSAFAGSFTNMDEVLAGSGAADSLTGIDADATWHLGSSHQYESTHTLDFSGFETLIGGSANDIFALEGAGSFSGMVNGGAGDDRISYTAYGSSAEVNLGAGTATALGGYTSIEGALGSVYSDTLIGTAGNDTFNVTADGSGVVNGFFSFSAFETLDGALGTDVLSHAGYATAVVLDLENNTATGVDAFSGFEAFVGSGSAADEIHGKAAGSVFTINAADGGMVDTLLFSAYESLLGGAADDTFAFSGSGSLRGWLNGGLGTDTLNYSLYGSACCHRPGQPENHGRQRQGERNRERGRQRLQ